MVENTKDMITLIDPRGLVLFASPSWADVLGYPPDLLTGTSALELVHPDDLQTAEAAIAACLSGGRASVAAVRLRHLDGSWKVLEGVVSGIHDETGETTMILATSRDVSKRVRAEDELRQSRELYRTVVENTRDLVALLDLEGAIVYASPSHVEKLGRSALRAGGDSVPRSRAPTGSRGSTRRPHVCAERCTRAVQRAAPTPCRPGHGSSPKERSRASSPTRAG